MTDPVPPANPIDDARARLEAVSDPSGLLVAIFAHAPVGLQIYDPEGRCVLVNEKFRELFGDAPPPGYVIFDDTILVERGVADLVRRAFTGEHIRLPPIWYDARELRNVEVQSGRRVAVAAELVPLRAASGAVQHVLFVFHDLTAERLAKESSERALRDAEGARVVAEIEAARASFLAEAGRVLSSSLDFEGTLSQIARLATPTLADFCLVDLVEENGEVRRVAAVHSDPASQPLLDELRDRFPPLPGSTQPAARVMESGLPELLTEIDMDVISARTRSSEHVELIKKLGIRSHLAVPMIIDGRRLGAISLGYVGARRYDPRDVGLGEALAARAALAIENARLYREARRAREHAEAASRSKDEFLAMLGHELRNPLAPITTALQLIELRDGKSKERSIIRRQVDHLTRLVDDLLDVARITRGKIDIKRQPMALREAVLRGIDLARPIIEQRAHHLQVDVPDQGLDLAADPVRIAQVVSNLLTNAARYTPPGGHIAVMATRSGDELVLKVRDDGLGIPASLLPRVFEQFVQGPRAPDRSEGGLGIGLAIVKALTELHGGRVMAESAGAGRGSTFTVILPALDASESIAPDKPRDPPGTQGRILVVDDNVDAAEMLSIALDAMGYATQVANDPLTALEIAAQQRPQVALLDIGLPIIDGYELARRMRQLPALAGVRLVAVTGYGQPGDRERALEAGFDHHMVKPVALDALAEVVRGMIAGAR